MSECRDMVNGGSEGDRPGFNSWGLHGSRIEVARGATRLAKEDID